MTDLTREEAQAQATINEILERLTRIETRLCKLMLHQNVHPGIAPAPHPMRWEDRADQYREGGTVSALLSWLIGAYPVGYGDGYGRGYGDGNGDGTISTASRRAGL